MKLWITPWRGGLRASVLLTAALAIAALAAPVAAQAASGGDVRVMTRNLYLGTGLTNLPGTSGITFITNVTTDYGNVVANDFPSRAQALAAEIQAKQPDVVGLQEVSTWRTGFPDSLLGNPTPNAPTVTYDFLDSLLQALGGDYTLVTKQENADVEAPRFDPSSPYTFIPGAPGLYDTRLTDADAIIAKTSLATATSGDRVVAGSEQGSHYAFPNQLRVPIGGSTPVNCYASVSVPAGCAEFTRGWQSVDLIKGGSRYRVFNSHLETEDAPPIQVAQGAEALTAINGSPYPVVVLGDYNSAADGSTTATYRNLTKGGLKDVWSAANGDAGFSCCQAELLNNAGSNANERIDLVLTKGKIAAKSAALTGNSVFQSSAPLWASDHFGVAATVKIP